jgi:hypothetical protein
MGFVLPSVPRRPGRFRIAISTEPPSVSVGPDTLTGQQHKTASESPLFCLYRYQPPYDGITLRAQRFQVRSAKVLALRGMC